MDGSHKCIVEFKKPDTKTYILCDEEKKVKKQSTLSEFRIMVIPGTQDVIRKEHERRFWGTGNIRLLYLEASSVC